MSESIISNERVCYICGTPFNLHKHHIYEGMGRRQISERYGCWVYLCAEHHNMSQHSVHYNKDLDLTLKRCCQREWESKYGTRDDFISAFRRSYL